MEDVAARALGRVAANGIELAYETFGDPGAPPVVLIMGLATQMIAWPDELCEGLARRGLFVVRFDNRDVGESTHLRNLPPPRLADIVVRRRPPPYSISDMAADVAGLLDGLGLGEAHLVGASMGGFIAQAVALEHAARVRSLTLMMTSTGSRRVGQPRPRVYARLLRRRVAAGRPAVIAAAVETFRLIGSPGFAFDEQYVRDIAGRSWDRSYDPAGYRRQLAASASQPNRTADLRRVTVPALVIHGLHDPLVAPSGGLAIARAIPGSRLVGFSGMGHDLPRALWPEFVREIAALAELGEQRRRQGSPAGVSEVGRLSLRSGAMPANRMNHDEFYAAMARHDDARLRKILWTVYWRGNAQLRERIEDELRPQGQPKVKPKKELPDPAAVLAEVTTFAGLVRDGAYMAGDRRVHHTERSRWRHTFRRLAADALAALAASDPAPAQQAVAKMVDLACDMKRYDYVHSDDPVEAAKFVVPEAVAALWESVLRHDGFAAFAGRVPEQLVRWEADYGWTRRGYGQVAEKETPLAVPLARLLTTPDMWRTFAESYLEALEAAGRADPKRPRTVYGSFDETSYRRRERTDDLAEWHEMLLDRFAGTPEDELLDRLVASPALAGPELSFLRARIAERRGDVSQAATLVSRCLKELPGRQVYLDFAVKVGAELPSPAREIAAERAQAAWLAAQPHR